MKRALRVGLSIGAALAAGAGLVAATGAAHAQKLQQPAWAYAIPLTPAPPAAPAGDAKLSIEGAKTGPFSIPQIRGDDKANPGKGPADWFPGDHPPMPKIVADGGDLAQGVTPCSLCHYPNGKGRAENAGISGLPKDYFIEQLHDMRAGLRTSAEPLKDNAFRMDRIAKGMTEAEIEASAAYFSSFPWTQWIRVVESPTAPKVRSAAGLYLPLTGADAGVEPIAGRIVEVPEHPDHAETLRDPRDGFIAYAPPGSVARGKAIVTTGADGKTLACAVCHGGDLKGVGAIPGIASRSPSYIARQLNDFEQGTRHGAMGALMAPVVAKLTPADITDIAAYLASIPAPPAPRS